MTTNFTHVQTAIRASRERGFGRIGNRHPQAKAHLERWAGIRDMLEAQIGGVLKREITIRQETRLSEVGKVEEVRKLGQAVTPDFTYLGREVEQTRQAMGRLRGVSLDFLSIPKGANETVEYLRG